MSERFLERLSRFTPDAGGLNRDELLFEAGRRSARPDRRWKSTAFLLGAAQALTLLLLWPSARPVPPGSMVTVVTAPAPSSSALDSLSVESPASGDLWSARRGLSGAEPENRPAFDLTLIDSEPPLKAFSPDTTSLLN
jgi:hypothetical protein